MKQISLFLLALLLSACGLKGPLTLPTPDNNKSVKQPIIPERQSPQDSRSNDLDKEKATQQPYDDITGYA